MRQCRIQDVDIRSAAGAALAGSCRMRMRGRNGAGNWPGAPFFPPCSASSEPDRSQPPKRSWRPLRAHRLLPSLSARLHSCQCAQTHRYQATAPACRDSLRMTYGYKRARPAQREFRTDAVRGQAIRNSLQRHVWSMTVTVTPVSRNCSCCAASAGDRPISRSRSWSRTKCAVGTRSPQSRFT